MTLTLIDLCGAVALLLWGVHMVQTALQRACGVALRRGLASALGNRLSAFTAGLGVTAVLQSSTATGLMITAFAGDGLVGLVPALAVMLGANVGTTLLVQLLSFDISRIAPLFVLIGVMMFRSGGATRTRDLGRGAIGLGLMLLALGRLLAVVTPYEDAPSLRLLLGMIATQPLIAMMFGALITWAAHSSVAVVLLVMSFAAKGVVPLETGLALVVGANLGTAINPVLEAPTGADRTGRQVAIGNLATRILGAAVALPLLRLVGPHLLAVEDDLPRAVANFHTAFNVGIAFVVMPLLGPFAWLLKRWLPARFEVPDPGRPIYLDRAAQETPAVALGGAAREALRMGDVLEEMLRGAAVAVETGDRRKIAETRRLDDVLDKLDRAIKTYLTEIDPDTLTEDDEARLAAILTFTTNLEQAGDTIDRGAMAAVGRQLKRGLALPREDRRTVLAVIDRVGVNTRAAATVFMTQDIRAARLLADEKASFREIEAQATRSHFDRLREDAKSGVAGHTLALDLIRDLKAANDRLVAGAAYPVLERGGELGASRLREPPDMRE